MAKTQDEALAAFGLGAPHAALAVEIDPSRDEALDRLASAGFEITVAVANTSLLTKGLRYPVRKPSPRDDGRQMEGDVGHFHMLGMESGITDGDLDAIEPLERIHARLATEYTQLSSDGNMTAACILWPLVSELERQIRELRKSRESSVSKRAGELRRAQIAFAESRGWSSRTIADLRFVFGLESDPENAYLSTRVTKARRKSEDT